MFGKLFITAALLTGLVAPVEARPLTDIEKVQASVAASQELCTWLSNGLTVDNWIDYHYYNLVNAKANDEATNTVVDIMSSAVYIASESTCPQYKLTITSEVLNASHIAQ